MIAKIKEFQYNRRDVKAGILHIGVGNFHRAHEEFFTNHLLKDTDQQEWGIFMEPCSCRATNAYIAP